MTRDLNLLFLSVLLLFGLARAQQDPYSERLVQDVLTSHVIASQMEKAISGLGDRAAVAVIRSLADGGMHDPAELKKVLWLLRTAFSVPQKIAEPADRAPKASLFLLRCMSESPAGSELADDIKEDEAYYPVCGV
ncbi:MAG TPA: hypothetical protein VJ999_06015 [Candidatus Sulfotelmatobacter sp.]|nr:hypothetical protein [Candidatus Sulfotelmatobacter sp.]